MAPSVVRACETAGLWARAEVVVPCWGRHHVKDGELKFEEAFLEQEKERKRGRKEEENREFTLQGFGCRFVMWKKGL